MARKKITKQDNVMLTSEEQENSVADITGTLIESPTKQTSPTLGQAQSLALREAEEEKPKPMAQESPKELASIAEKQVFDCMSFLNKQRLKPLFTNYGKKASCIIVDNGGNNVLPLNQVTKHPMIVYGDDKDRALINAVNALRAKQDGAIVIPQGVQAVAPNPDFIPGTYKGKNEVRFIANTAPTPPWIIGEEDINIFVNALHNLVQKWVRIELKYQKNEDPQIEELKDKISELLRKL